jgi:hypothetical protein
VRKFYARKYKKMVILYVYLHMVKEIINFTEHMHIKKFRWCAKEKSFAQRAREIVLKTKLRWYRRWGGLGAVVVVKVQLFPYDKL